MDEKDQLTDLLSRNQFLFALDESLTRAAQEHTTLTLIMLDIDNLLPINEKYGHVAGDELIRNVASRFAATFTSRQVAQMDYAGRYGGDEFMAVMANVRNETVFDLAEELRHSFEKNGLSFELEGQSIYIPCTVAMGIASFPVDATGMDSLVDKAKQALYRAKIAGGNAVCFYWEKDGLTGLLNHYGILRRLDEAINRAYKTGEPLSIVALDIDSFFDINSRYGHVFGDEVLRRLGHFLSSNLNEEISAGRYGGDEFVVVMPNTRPEAAFVLMEEIRKTIDSLEFPVASNPKEKAHFTISGGIATFPTDAEERVDLIRKADEALYQAKRFGRNRICLPTSTQMVTKTSYYTRTQLERLATVAKEMEKTEAFLLREALDDLLRKYDESDHSSS